MQTPALAGSRQTTRAPSPIASRPVSRNDSPQRQQQGAPAPGIMQRSVQHTTLQGAQQSQSRSALVSQRFAGNQNPALAGLKRPREALATPSASVAPSPAVGRQGGLLTPGFRPQNGVQPLRLRTPGVQNSGIAPLRSLGSSVAAGTGGTPRTLNLQRKLVTPASKPLGPMLQPSSQHLAPKKPRPM